MTPMTNEERFKLRGELEAAGSMVAGYDGRGFQLQIKRGKFGDVDQRAKELGLTLRGNSLFHFPLGSDNPPEEFRHWTSRYSPERGFKTPGFWLCATYDATRELC